MFGSHLSIAGGIANALREAERLGLDTVQVFTKNQRQWRFSPLKEGDVAEWRTEMDRLGWQGRCVAHNSYLINLATPDAEMWEKSVVTQREEIERCEALGIAFLVSHPGAHRGEGDEIGLQRIADAYLRLLRETEGYSTVVCIENTVGSGSNLGGPFEHLASIRERIIDGAKKAKVDPDEAAERIGFCFDTCHAHAYGHDMSTEASAKAALANFEKICGKNTLRVVHCNDSKGAMGSHRDLHAHIGEGTIGLEGFAAVVNHPRLRRVPKIMETPKPARSDGRTWDEINVERLRGLVRTGKTGAASKKKAGSGGRKAGRGAS